MLSLMGQRQAPNRLEIKPINQSTGYGICVYHQEEIHNFHTASKDL